MKRVKILGAGISGLTAAINLAKAGYTVDVYEAKSDVGKRFNGDVQGLENWSDTENILDELKKMNLEVNFDCDPFTELTVTNCKKYSKLKMKTPLYYLVKRGSFKGALDYGLKEQAEKSGVNMIFNKTLDSKKADIVATGPIFKESLGIDVGIIFKTNHPDISVGVINDELAYKGYAYLLITKGYACLCTVVDPKTSDIHKELEKTKKFFTERYGITIKKSKKVGGVGSFSPKHAFEIKYKDHETLFVGEAAGLQDLLWGFGMRLAMESGYLAAKSIISNEDYEKLAEERFRDKLKAGIVNRYLWENYNEKAFVCLHNPILVRKLLYWNYNYDFFQKLLYKRALKYMKKAYPNLKL